MHAILKNTAPPECSHALLALLFKKGGPRDPQNYRPICLIPSLQTLTAAFLNDQLVQFSEKFSLIHKSQHGGLKNHRCGDHIYDVVARNIQMGGPAYHLYIDFNKAFTSVPHETLWSVLRAYQFPDSTIEAFKNLYSNPVDKPVVHGTPHSSYELQRGVRQGAQQVQPYPFYSSMCYFLTSTSFHFNPLTPACMLLSTTFFSEAIQQRTWKRVLTFLTPRLGPLVWT